MMHSHTAANFPTSDISLVRKSIKMTVRETRVRSKVCNSLCYFLGSQHQHHSYISHISVTYQSYISHMSVTYMNVLVNNQFNRFWNFQICILTSFGGIVFSKVDCSMCWLLPWFTFNMVLYNRWMMMMRFNVLLLNLLGLWNAKNFFAVTVSWYILLHTILLRYD